VSVVSAEEKRAMTIVVLVSSSGVLLPFQAVYEGKSSVSCLKTISEVSHQSICGRLPLRVFRQPDLLVDAET
jgi:hypothetical protein